MTGSDEMSPEVQVHPGPPVQPENSGFWSLVLHEDLARVHRDWQHFSSEGADGPGSRTGGDAIRDMSRADGVGTMMIVTDPPKHTAYRKLVNRGFTPRSIAVLEPRLRAVTHAAIDAVAGSGGCDFVQDLAAMVPLQAIGELLLGQTCSKPGGLEPFAYLLKPFEERPFPP